MVVMVVIVVVVVVMVVVLVVLVVLLVVVVLAGDLPHDLKQFIDPTTLDYSISRVQLWFIQDSQSLLITWKIPTDHKHFLLVVIGTCQEHHAFNE